MKRAILILCFSVAAIAIGKPNTTDGKYDVDFIYCLADSKITYYAMEELEPSGETITIKGVNSIWATKSLFWCIKNLANVNGSLWEYYFSTDGAVASTKALAVLHAISSNNSNFQAKLSQYAFDCTQEFATDTSKLKESYDKVVEKVNKNDSSNFTKLRNAIDKESAAIQSEITDVTAEMTSLRGQIAKNEGDVKSAIARVESLQNQLTQLSLSASLNNQASSFNLTPIVMPIASIADSNFTNAIASISKYLGAEDEVNTNGVTFVPPTIDGDPAPDILSYLNSKGVIGYQSDDSGVSTNSPFSARFESNGINVVATFGAPVNWADGRSIVVTNGTMSIVSGAFWHYDPLIGAFVGCSAQVGSKTFFEPTMAYDTPGTVYALIDYSGAALTLTLTSSSSSTDGRSIAIAVGTLVSAQDGSVYSKMELGQPIVVFCYE